jgi:hypothetical protein
MNDIRKHLQNISDQLWLVIVLLIVLPPVGIYLLWKGEHFVPKTRKIISLVAGLWFLLYLIDAALAPTGQDEYGSCSATFYENGCTYYRDDNCNVVAKSCD